MKFAIDAIKIGERKRELGDITSLAQSIKELGLINPITVKPDGSLIAGYHRLEACKRLGWTEIEVNATDLDMLQSELAEIDENLIRNELHWFDRDKQLARRKEIYEELYPETKKGNTTEKVLNAIRTVKPNDSVSLLPFTQDTANKVNVSKSTVELSIQRAKTFTEEQGEILKRAAVPQTDATKLARLEEPQRIAVIQTLADGKAKDIKGAKSVLKQEHLAEESKNVVLPDSIQMLHGDFRTLGREIPDASVDLVFTDPPYHDEHLGLWSDLAAFAHRILKPGGILISYSGQLFLPQVLNALGSHLDYCWMLSVVHDHGHIQIWKHSLWNDWKPVVMFSKGKPVEHEWLDDLYRGDKGDKDTHKWSQGEGEAAYFIEKLTKPGQMIVDPMCGSGTILRAAHKMKRRGLGLEIDEARYQTGLGSMKGLEEVGV